MEDGIFGILICAGVLTLWIIAFIRMQKYGGSKGVARFFLCLGSIIALCALLFAVIVVPVMDCHEFLCGLGEILIFMGLSLILLIALPIVMMTAMVAALKRTNHYKKPGEDLLDV